jgi:hypothetical protein
VLLVLGLNVEPKVTQLADTFGQGLDRVIDQSLTLRNATGLLEVIDENLNLSHVTNDE